PWHPAAWSAAGRGTGGRPGRVELGLYATGLVDREVPICRLKKGMPVFNPGLKRRGLFFPGFVLQSVILLLVDLPALLQEVEELLKHWLLLDLLGVGSQRAYSKPYQHSHQYTLHEVSHSPCLSFV